MKKKLKISFKLNISIESDSFEMSDFNESNDVSI